MTALQDLMLVGQQSDLSFAFTNTSAGRVAGSRLSRLFGTAASMVAHKTNANGHHRSISSGGGSEGDDDDDDLDMRSEDNVASSDGETAAESSSTTDCPMLENKVKLSFSVESILNGEVERRAERKRRIADQIQRPAPGKPAKNLRLDSKSDMKCMMRSAAEVIDMSLPVYRPLPVRYHQSATSGN